jgi:primosomal protein N' (replication factor Y)
MSVFAEVALPVPLRKSFFYAVPEKYEKKIKKGTRVLVPFRKNLLTGYVIAVTGKAPLKNIELKEIKELLDGDPVFSASFLCFTKRLSDYYYSSWGEVLQTSLPPSYTIKTRVVLVVCEKGKKYLMKETCRGLEREVLQSLMERPYTETYLRRKFKTGGWSSFISRMEEKGLIKRQRELRRPRERELSIKKDSPAQLEMDYSLDSTLRETADRIKKALGKGAFCSFLIAAAKKKRETIYMDLIKKAITSGLKTLFLVPEIEFTDRILNEFKKKLGENAAFLHSRLSEKQRELTWKGIRTGQTKVVVGPRSVLLSPVENVGLIIVDKEEDDSYYQRENPVYDARVGARLRAEQEKAVLVYGSESPSAGLLYQLKKKDRFFDLDRDRKSRFKRDIIDSRKHAGILSHPMKEGIKKRLERKEPVLLFFNRQGYASSLVCSRCDYTPKCRNCEALLTYYKREKKLICRYCHSSEGLLMKCPECGARMVPGSGFGMEVLEEELKKNFPESRIKSIYKFAVKKAQEEEIIKDYKEGKINILLGTQMLSHMPELPPSCFVGIFYPESILRLADFRAGYKTFRYIREIMAFVKNDRDCEFLIQTYLPNSYPINHAVSEDIQSFYEHELKNRRLMGYPPFCFLAELLFYGKDLRSIARKSRRLLDVLKRSQNHIEILGPSFAPVRKLRGRSRVQVIIKSKERRALDRALEKIVREIRTKKSIFIYE